LKVNYLVCNVEGHFVICSADNVVRMCCSYTYMWIQFVSQNRNYSPTVSTETASSTHCPLSPTKWYDTVIILQSNTKLHYVVQRPTRKCLTHCLSKARVFSTTFRDATYLHPDIMHFSNCT